MTVTIETKCDDATSLYWREVGTSSWAQLASSPPNAPIITAPDSETTTFRFVQYSGSTHDVIFTEDTGGSSQSLPASVVLDPGDTQLVYFAKASASTPQWYGGYVKVSPAE